jgi:hypothetical protein
VTFGFLRRQLWTFNIKSTMWTGLLAISRPSEWEVGPEEEGGVEKLLNLPLLRLHKMCN